MQTYRFFLQLTKDIWQLQALAGKTIVATSPIILYIVIL